MSYLEQLMLAYNEGTISKLEKLILKFLWEFLGIELPPNKYLSPIYNFFIFYFIAFISVTLIIMFFFIIYATIESIEESIKLYSLVEHKYFNIIAFGTILCLVVVEVTKNKNTWCDDLVQYWRVNLGNCINKKTNFVFIIFAILVSIFAIVLFKVKFIIFAINTILIIVIYDEIKILLHFISIMGWIKTSLDDIEFQVLEEEQINNISIDKIHKVKLYSLLTRFSYKINHIKYFSSQMYIDEPRDKVLFQNESDYKIKQWIEDNKNIAFYAYVNPNNFKEAILFKDILFASYFGKIFIVFGTIITLYIVNNYLNLEYYLQ